MNDNALNPNQAPTTNPIQPQSVRRAPNAALGAVFLIYGLFSFALTIFTFFIAMLTTEFHSYPIIARLIMWLIPISNLVSGILGTIISVFFIIGRKTSVKFYASLIIFLYLPLLTWLAITIIEALN